MAGGITVDVQGRINHSGPHTNIRRGLFSHTRTQDFLSLGSLCFSQKVDDLFSRQSSSTYLGKKLTVGRGPLAAEAPPMVQPAQWIIRPCRCAETNLLPILLQQTTSELWWLSGGNRGNYMWMPIYWKSSTNSISFCPTVIELVDLQTASVLVFSALIRNPTVASYVICHSATGVLCIDMRYVIGKIQISQLFSLLCDATILPFSCFLH